ncbi:MAG: WecB/TagA/CpsF family glycosyltransferase [Verrucomicrobiota bacterium]|nr:WecB/TagA/CpsF family glycosyltransferase [Verrucomicrobiota bacterium]
MPTHRILGIDFFGGTSREAVDEISRTGGLLVAPAAPSMIALCRDTDYRRAILSAQIAIADSGFMVLLWKLFTGESVPRISGLEHVKRLLEHETVRQPGATLWLVPTETSREKLIEFLASLEERPPCRLRVENTDATARVPPSDHLTPSPAGSVTATSRLPVYVDPSPRDSIQLSAVSSQVFPIYIAPKYGRPVADETLLGLVRQTRPKHIVVAVGGGIQDKLGHYLLEHLDYRPAIHCIGAALGFITGDQVRIPDWADKYYLGWFFRSVAQPKVFIPRFWSARKLPWLIWRYRERLPPLEKLP